MISWNTNSVRFCENIGLKKEPGWTWIGYDFGCEDPDSDRAAHDFLIPLATMIGQSVGVPFKANAHQRKYQLVVMMGLQEDATALSVSLIMGK